MICSTCGSPTQAGENFCGTCGSFLAWESDDTAADSARITADQASAEPTTTSVEPTPQPAVSHTESGSGDAQDDSAGPEQPAAVQPAKPEARRPVARLGLAEPTAEPNAVPCRACDTPNPPERRFCRRCGVALSAPAVAAKQPWWKRIRWSRTARRRWWSILARIVRRIIALALLIFLIAILARYGRNLIGQAHQLVHYVQTHQFR